MTKIIKHKKLLIYIVVLFLILESAIFSVFYYIYTMDSKKLLEAKTSSFHTQIVMGRYYLNDISKVLHDTLIDERAKEILYKALHVKDTKEQNVLRKRLQNLYKEDYAYMQSLGIRQFHFHLPGAISFLRMHRPNKYGDSLFRVRPSIVEVDKTKKPVHCFEEGRIFNGFRNVFPVFAHGEFVGTVEISYSFGAFLEYLLRAHKQDSYVFLVKDEVVREKVFQSEQKNYILSGFEGYRIDKSVIDRPMPLSLTQRLYLNSQIADVAQRLEKGENFSVDIAASKSGFSEIIVSFEAVQNIEGKTVAYIVRYQNSDIFNMIKQRVMQVFFILQFASLIILFLVGYILYKEEQKVQQSSEEAIKDQLTEIYNRRGFDALLEARIAEARRYKSALSVIFCDIDFFKDVNDTYGHDAGDRVLREMVEVVLSTVRESDIFARWGGEEFVILLPHTSIEDAYILAQKIRKIIKTHYFQDVGALTCSFGVTEFDFHEDGNSFMKRVDTMLYKAKIQGRDRVVSSHMEE